MITRLKVKNFKIHKETEIFFDSALSILTGENNSGKTSLLESLMIFVECYQNSLRKIQRTNNKKIKAGQLQVGQYDFASQFIPFFSSVRSENYYELFYQESKTFELIADFRVNDVAFTLGFEVKQGRNQTAYHIEARTTPENLIRFNEVSPATLLAVIKSVPVASVMRNEPYMPPKMLDKQLSENAQTSTLRNRLLQISALHKLTDLQNQLSFIMGFEDFDLNVAFNPNDDLYITAEFRTDKSANYQDIAMLGSGSLQMLEVLVSLNLSSKSFTRLVLLDEPDSFLHRRLQQKLISKLREISKNQVQIVCTTHNEQVISSAQLNELYHLGNPKEGQKVHSLSSDLPQGRVKGLISPKAKSNLYEALGVSASGMNILEAIEAERLVLVEGRTDALYLQALQAKRQQLFPITHPKKVAFWSINGISDIGNKLKYWKEIFSSIKNGQSLWDKASLLLDSDFLDETEMNEVATQAQKIFNIRVMTIQSYTFESSFLLDLPRFIQGLSTVFNLKIEQVSNKVEAWCQTILERDQSSSIENQRRSRSSDFAVFKSSQLNKLCEGNGYLKYVKNLNADPQKLARVSDKSDVFLLFKDMATLSTINFSAYSDEALLLYFIEELDAHSWPQEWTPLLKEIYG